MTQPKTDLSDIFGPKGRLAARLPELEYRPSQLQMARAVDQAITAGGTLLAEAGTGTGKTLAYLVPALLSGRKTVVATGTKPLQEQLFFKDIPLLTSILPDAFEVSLMKGRGNYLCRRSLRRRLAEAPTRRDRQTLQNIQRWSATSPRGDRAELDFLSENDPLWDGIAAWSETCQGTSCEDYETCFLTRMRQEAAAADLVIVNHHLFLADAVLRDTSLFQVIPSCAILILDEAHLLEEVATDFFGTEISDSRIDRLLHDVHREGAVLSAAGRDIVTHATRLAESSARFFGSLELPEAARRLGPGDLEGPCGDAGGDLARGLYLLHDLIQAATEKPEGLLACARRAREQAATLREFLALPPSAPDGDGGPPVVRWIERRGRSLCLRISPLDVADDFRRTILNSADTVVLTSATLVAGGRFDFLRGRLGIQDAREFSAGSPFDHASQATLYVARHLPDPQDPAFVAAAAGEIGEILEITRGRGLVLFTSTEAMETSARLLEGRLEFPLLVQGQAPRTQLLERFRREVASVLFATRSFWQGVDVVGEALSCLIVHRLPFGFPGEPILEARLEHIRQRGGDPFWEYQVPAAIITLRQGLGRLIRSAQDRGALCILDGRLLSRSYGRAFLESLPPAL